MSRRNVAIQLEPELEQMFQDCQRELDEAGSGPYHPEDHSRIMSLHVLGDDVYERQARMPGWNGTVSMLREPKVAIRHAVDWGIPTSKSAHAQKADFFNDLSQKMSREWDSTVKLAIRTYGKQGSLVSGVYRDHFPDDVKDRLRFLTHGSVMAIAAARLHEYLSKTRSPLFR
jgi:hypothetical protein